MARRSSIDVHVVLDTNSLFTQASDRLINEELSEFILERLENPDVKVTWYLPDIVRAERKHQMVIRAQRLLPHLAKVESLLGYSFAITAELLSERIDGVINREIARHKLVLRDLEASDVNWSELISRSVQRLPPFDPGENEKGFRDAIVLETFCRITNELPKSPNSCRIIFLTGDALLVDAAKARVIGRNNVDFFGDLELMRTTLNTLASALTQEIVDKILPLAAKIFFSATDQSSLYFKENVTALIETKFAGELRRLPDADFMSSRIKRQLIGKPAFLSKTGQRVKFLSRLTYEIEAIKTVWREAPLGSGPVGLGLNAMEGLSGSINNPLFVLSSQILQGGAGVGSVGGSGGFGLNATVQPNRSPYSITSPIGLSSEVVNPMVSAIVTRSGTHVFELQWSASLSARGKLSRPKIDGIEHKSTTWNEAS